MSQDSLSPFIKWSPFKSTDEKNPDIHELKAVEAETFPTEYSDNVKVQIRDGTDFGDAVLPLKSHNSANASLLNQWRKAVKEGKIKEGTDFKILTWLGISKGNKRPI